MATTAGTPKMTHEPFNSMVVYEPCIRPSELRKRALARTASQTSPTACRHQHGKQQQQMQRQFCCAAVPVAPLASATPLGAPVTAADSPPPSRQLRGSRASSSAAIDVSWQRPQPPSPSPSRQSPQRLLPPLMSAAWAAFQLAQRRSCGRPDPSSLGHRPSSRRRRCRRCRPRSCRGVSRTRCRHRSLLRLLRQRWRRRRLLSAGGQQQELRREQYESLVRIIWLSACFLVLLSVLLRQVGLPNTDWWSFWD